MNSSGLGDRVATGSRGARAGPFDLPDGPPACGAPGIHRARAPRTIRVVPRCARDRRARELRRNGAPGGDHRFGRNPWAIKTQNYVRPEITLEPHVSFRAIATFSPRPPYFLFLPFLAVFLAAVFFFAALRLAAIMLHLL